MDVPGHERLIRTMVAGAAGLDAVLLCVSAVDGVMPQTVEHLGICRLLGVRQGAVVITMADLVDEDFLGLAIEDARDAVAGTFLESTPIVPFSAVSGRGREELLAVLASFTPAPRPANGPFRLPVDQVFVRPGFGTIVRGTAWSGELRDGATVHLAPGLGTARVRGVQVHGEAATVARAGQRVALNLAGVDREDLGRGIVVASEALPEPHVVDVRYEHLPGASDLEDGAPIRLLLGTAEALGHVYFAEERERVGGRGRSYAQLRLDEPVPCLPGDRFVIRRPSPADTVGGGVVLDPWARRMRRRERVAWGEELKRLAAGQVAVYLERAGEEGLTVAETLLRCGSLERGRTVGDRVFAPGVVGRLEGVLLESLATFHAAHPLALGAGRRELRRGRLAHLPDRVFDALVDRLVASGLAEVRGPLVRLTGFRVTLGAEQLARRDAILATVRAAGLEGCRPAALEEAHPGPETAALVHLLASGGALVQVANLGWVGAEALAGLAGAVRGWFAEHEQLSPSDFKELTGLSRRVAIPLLEWLDASGVTRRNGDVRQRGVAR